MAATPEARWTPMSADPSRLIRLSATSVHRLRRLAANKDLSPRKAFDVFLSKPLDLELTKSEREVRARDQGRR
jgi:hypothetical protein